MLMSRVVRPQLLLQLMAAGARRGWPGGSWHILLYHNVPARFAKTFSRQVEWAKDYFQVCGLSDGLAMFASGELGRPLLTFTFDDADISTYEVVIPARRAGMCFRRPRVCPPRFLPVTKTISQSDALAPTTRVGIRRA